MQGLCQVDPSKRWTTLKTIQALDDFLATEKAPFKNTVTLIEYSFTVLFVIIYNSKIIFQILLCGSRGINPFSLIITLLPIPFIRIYRVDINPLYASFVIFAVLYIFDFLAMQ